MESEQTKRLQRTPDGSYIAELEELSHRLDALEAAHNTLAVDVEDMKPHDASGYTLPKDQPVKCPHCGVEVSGRTWNMSCPMCGVIMLPATETVGERIATKCAFWEKRRECAAAIDAAVKGLREIKGADWIDGEVGVGYRMRAMADAALKSAGAEP